MGRQALIAAICWLTLSSTYGDSVQYKSPVDNDSVASAPRLYRHVPVGMYASAAPYTFQFLTHLNTASSASQPVPVKMQPLTYLKDSYGKFVQSPQMLSYKAALPQQYVTLQPKLPEHLTQPLVAATTPNFQFKQSAPQVFFGAPYRIPNLQGPTPTPINQFPSFGQLYAGQVKSLAPTSTVHSQSYSYVPLKQISTNKPIITNTNEQYKKEPNFQVEDSHHASNEGSKSQRIQEISHAPQSEVKFQRIQEAPQVIYGEQKFQRLQNEPTTTSYHSSSSYASKYQETPKSYHVANSQSSHHEKPQIQALPAKTIVTYVDDNGKKTTVKLDNKPAFPLLDLTLLEPLTFDNPLVPQVQHFLPRINQATYKKLPQADIDEVKNYQKELVVSKTMSYDSEEDEKPKSSSKKKHKKPTHSTKSKNIPNKTTVTYHETLEDSPEVTYEIHAPNYKETVKQNAVSYNKKTESEPVHVTYGSKSQSDPVTYSFSRSSKEPLHVKEIHYSSEEPAPLVYNFKPGEHTSEDKSQSSAPLSNEEYTESSQESDEDDSGYNSSSEQYNDLPKSSEEYQRPSHKENGHHHDHSHRGENHHHTSSNSGENYHHKPSDRDENHHHKNSHSVESQHHKPSHSGEKHHHKPSHSDETQYHKPSQGGGSHYHKDDSHHHHKPTHSDESHPHKSHSDDSNYHKPSSIGESHHQQPYQEQSHQNKPTNVGNQHSQPLQKEKSHQHYTTSAPQNGGIYHDQPQLYPGTTQFSSNFAFQPKQYEENIRLVAPNAQIKVDPNQHVHFVKSTVQPQAHTQTHHPESYVPQRVTQASPAPIAHPRPSPTPQGQVHYSTPHSQPARYNGPAPHIQEKSKHVIIHDESPDEKHMLREQMRQEMIDQEENNEDDFEKAYQESAQGFPAYNFKDAEKDIFDPESYGVPPEHLEFDIKNTPFQQYQEEGDAFPENTRTSYKDARDKMKEDYYSDYSISKPESLLDRYNNKLGYYKLYKQQKPDYFSANEQGRNNKKSEKFTVAPSFQFEPAKGSSNAYFGQLMPKQQSYEYDFSQGKPKADSSAFASGPLYRYRSRTNFVEPQFQYGFEPLAIPQLLDSELAAMASNDSPESKPATRKKIYKENWYIKKTSTSAGAPAS